MDNTSTILEDSVPKKMMMLDSNSSTSSLSSISTNTTTEEDDLLTSSSVTTTTTSSSTNMNSPHIVDHWTSFPQKVFTILMDDLNRQRSERALVWGNDGRHFQICNTKELISRILPKHFRHNRMSSFTRQLNIYGFQRIWKGEYRGFFYHPHFARNKPMDVIRVQRIPNKRLQLMELEDKSDSSSTKSDGGNDITSTIQTPTEESIPQPTTSTTTTTTSPVTTTIPTPTVGSTVGVATPSRDDMQMLFLNQMMTQPSSAQWQTFLLGTMLGLNTPNRIPPMSNMFPWMMGQMDTTVSPTLMMPTVPINPMVYNEVLLQSVLQAQNKLDTANSTETRTTSIPVTTTTTPTLTPANNNLSMDHLLQAMLQQR